MLKAQARIGIMPCIRAEADAVLMYVDVIAYAPVDQTTVFLWLISGGERVEDSLARCSVSFRAAGEKHRCEARVTPPNPVDGGRLLPYSPGSRTCRRAGTRIRR